MKPIFLGIAVSLAAATGVVQAAEEKASPSAPPVASSLVFEPEGASPIEVFENQTVRQVMRVRNTGTRPITIRRVDPAPPPGTAHFEPRVVEPGQSGQLVLEKPMAEERGLQTVRFHLLSDDPSRPSQPVSFPVFVQSAYYPELPDIDFGYADRRTEPSRTLTIDSLETDALRVVSIVEKPDWLILEPAAGRSPQQVQLRAKLAGSVPLGELSRRIVLRTNVTAQPELVVRVRAHVHGDVTATPPSLSFGAVEQGKPAALDVELRTSDGKGLELAKLEADPTELDVSSTACGTGCLRVHAALRTDAMKAIGNREIVVLLKDRDERVRIPYSGLIVKAGTNIKVLGVIDEKTDLKIDGKTGGKP